MRIATLILFAAVIVSASACGAGGSNAREPGGATTAKTEELPEPGPLPKGKYATALNRPLSGVRRERHGETGPEGCMSFGSLVTWRREREQER
jgi:hypothetical protein